MVICTPFRLDKKKTASPDEALKDSEFDSPAAQPVCTEEKEVLQNMLLTEFAYPLRSAGATNISAVNESRNDRLCTRVSVSNPESPEIVKDMERPVAVVDNVVRGDKVTQMEFRAPGAEVV